MGIKGVYVVKALIAIIIRYLKLAWEGYKLKKLKKEIDRDKRQAIKETEEAINDFNDLMSLYDEYKRGEVEGDSNGKNDV